MQQIVSLHFAFISVTKSVFYATIKTEVMLVTKVAKTIKRLRVQNNMTQEALAEKLHVTRQTVSGWENNRTQPDIETLMCIAEVFSVEIEELIYGQSRSQREKKTDPQKLIIVIFAVIGSLLLGCGCIFVFGGFWEHIPDALLSVFAFVPMLAGQAVAFYAYRKKYDSLPWREGAAVLWCAGCAATVALADSIFSVSTSFFECFLFDGLLFLPVIFILDSVSPLVAYYAAVLSFGISKLENTGNILYFFVTITLLLVGIFFTLTKRKNKEDVRYIYSVWISTVACFVLLGVCGFEIEEGFFALFGCAFLALYMTDKGTANVMPAASLGLLGTAVVSVVNVIRLHPDVYYYSGFEFEPISLVSFVFAVLFAVGGVLLGKKNLLANRPKLLFCAFAAVVCLLSFAGDADVFGEWIFYPALLAGVAQGACLIVLGARLGRFIPLNLGILMIIAQLASVVYIFELDLFGYGILFIIVGAAILLINFRFSKRVKELARKEQEVQSDE